MKTNDAKDAAICFQAQIFKIQTLIDGGLRLTLDIGSVEPAVIVALFDAKHPGIVLEVAAVGVSQSITNGKTETDKRTARNPIELAGG